MFSHRRECSVQKFKLHSKTFSIFKDIFGKLMKLQAIDRYSRVNPLKILDPLKYEIESIIKPKMLVLDSVSKFSYFICVLHLRQLFSDKVFEILFKCPSLAPIQHYRGVKYVFRLLGLI